MVRSSLTEAHGHPGHWVMSAQISITPLLPFFFTDYVIWKLVKLLGSNVSEFADLIVGNYDDIIAGYQTQSYDTYY